MSTRYSRYKYTPDEMPQDEFLSKFVVREEEFLEVFEDIQESDYSVPNQHYIIVGQRGQGKTTLLRKIMIAIEEDKKLSKFLLAVKFTEEQYQIRSLSRLWEEVADYLQTLHEDIFPDILDQMEEHFNDDDYEEKSFLYLERELKQKGKKLVLLIDNIDDLLGKLKPKEQERLREIMIVSPYFRIVGGSTKMLEQQFDYSKPFFEFFKIIRLQGLNREESVRFLIAIGEGEQQKQIEEIIKNSPQKIETLRRLTGGVPRTLVMLFDIFIDDKGDAFYDLLSILDDSTPLYKHRMDDLPPQLQDIIHTIAINWDGMLTKEIAKKTRLSSKVVSAQLKQLEKFEIVESESIGKNKIYRIYERFFNIWYLMRYGRKKDRQRVEWLVRFIESSTTATERESKAREIIGLLDKGEIKESYAYHMVEALSYAGLDRDLEHKMKERVKSFLTLKKSKFLDNVSLSEKELIESFFILYDKKDFNKAINLLLKSDKKSSNIFFMIGITYSNQKKYKKAEEYYLKAIKSGDVSILIILADLYSDNLKEYRKAEEYYLKAIECEDNKALNSLGILYKKQQEYKKAEEYYLKAIKSGDNGALNNLANLYSEQKEYKKAEKYYLKVINKGENRAFNNLGVLYKKQKKYKKAEESYLKAIEGGINEGYNNLSWLFFEKAQDIKKAIKFAKKGYDSNENYKNAHTLATIYLWAEEFSKSYEKFWEWLEYDISSTQDEDIIIYLTLLMAKKEYHKTKEIMELPKYQFKERFKPIWFALMKLMEKEYPIEIKKMGSELKESVDEVLARVEEFEERYAVSNDR